MDELTDELLNELVGDDDLNVPELDHDHAEESTYVISDDDTVIYDTIPKKTYEMEIDGKFAYLRTNRAIINILENTGAIPPPELFWH